MKAEPTTQIVSARIDCGMVAQLTLARSAGTDRGFKRGQSVAPDLDPAPAAGSTAAAGGAQLQR